MTPVHRTHTPLVQTPKNNIPALNTSCHHKQEKEEDEIDVTGEGGKVIVLIDFTLLFCNTVNVVLSFFLIIYTLQRFLKA